MKGDVNSPLKKPRAEKCPNLGQFLSLLVRTIHTSLVYSNAPMCLDHTQKGHDTNLASECSLDGIFASPFLRGTIVSLTVGLVNVSNFWNERVIWVWIREHGADG